MDQTLERMDAFFKARLDGHDEHMLTEIEVLFAYASDNAGINNPAISEAQLQTNVERFLIRLSLPVCRLSEHHGFPIQPQP